MSDLLLLAQSAGPREPKAGHKLAFEFARKLAESDVLDVILLINEGDVVDYSAWKDIGCEVIYVEHISSLRKMLVILFSLFRIPPRFCVRISPKARQFLVDQLAGKDYRQITFEFSQAMPYIDVIGDRKTKTIASVHDVQTQLVSRGSWFERIVFLAATSRFEKKMLKKFDTIYTLCSKDAELIKSLFNCQNVKIRPPIINQSFSKLKRAPNKIEHGSMLFWGAMDRIENNKAIENFIKIVFPKIQSKLPSAKLYVVGNNPPRSLLKLACENIVVTGYVDEPYAYFEKAQIGIVPLLRGAGIKIKTLEMLSAGLTVVATEIGAEGVDQNDKLFIEDINVFDKKIVSLLKKMTSVENAKWR